MAGDVAMTGRAGPDVSPSAPGQQDFPAVPGDDGEVTRDAAVPGPAEPAPVTPATPITPAPTSPPGTGGGAAVRRRLARLGAPRGGGVNPVLEPLIKTVRATHPKADIRLIERAYEVAAYCHAGQKRKSGDPFITHPLAVATILGELRHAPTRPSARRCCTTRSRTPPTRWRSCAASSAMTWRRWSTG